MPALTTMSHYWIVLRATKQGIPKAPIDLAYWQTLQVKLRIVCQERNFQISELRAVPVVGKSEEIVLVCCGVATSKVRHETEYEGRVSGAVTYLASVSICIDLSLSIEVSLVGTIFVIGAGTDL